MGYKEFRVRAWGRGDAYVWACAWRSRVRERMHGRGRPGLDGGDVAPKYARCVAPEYARWLRLRVRTVPHESLPTQRVEGEL